MAQEEKNEKDHSLANAIVGGVCGVTLGWFYKQEAGQALIGRIKESELARNIGADLATSTQKHLTEFAMNNVKAKTDELLSPKEENNKNSQDEDSDERDEKLQSLEEENKRLEEMINRLEQKINDQAEE